MFGSQSDRRAVLRSIVAAGAVATVPAVAEAAISAGHPDAELFALLDRWRAVDALSEHAAEAREQAEIQAECPTPQVLIGTEDDARQWCGARAGKPFHVSDIEDLSVWMSAPRRPEGITPGLVIPPSSFDDRASAILAAWSEHQIAVATAKERAGVPEAEARLKTIMVEWQEIARRVATTQVKTIAGLMAKLAALAPYYAVYTKGDAFRGDVREDADEDDVLRSVVRDAVALSQST